MEDPRGAVEDEDEDAADVAARLAAAAANLPHAAAPSPAPAGAPAAAAVAGSASGAVVPKSLKQILLAPEQNGRAVRQKPGRSSSQITILKGTQLEQTVTAISGTSPAEDPRWVVITEVKANGTKYTRAFTGILAEGVRIYWY